MHFPFAANTGLISPRYVAVSFAQFDFGFLFHLSLQISSPNLGSEQQFSGHDTKPFFFSSS